MRRANNDSGHRGVLLIALMIGILIGSLIIVALIRAPVISGTLPNSFGPCMYYIQPQNGFYLLIPQINVGGLVAGQEVVSTTKDFGAFFQPYINNEVTLGGGWNCFSNGEIDFQTSLIIKGNGIFFTCMGYERDNSGQGQLQGNLTPCLF